MKQHWVIFINVGNGYPGCLRFSKQQVMRVGTSDIMGGGGKVDTDNIQFMTFGKPSRKCPYTLNMLHKPHW
jgi:hypothetical protein